MSKIKKAQAYATLLQVQACGEITPDQIAELLTFFYTSSKGRPKSAFDWVASATVQKGDNRPLVQNVCISGEYMYGTSGSLLLYAKKADGLPDDGMVNIKTRQQVPAAEGCSRPLAPDLLRLLEANCQPTGEEFTYKPETCRVYGLSPETIANCGYVVQLGGHAYYESQLLLAMAGEECCTVYKSTTGAVYGHHSIGNFLVVPLQKDFLTRIGAKLDG